MRLTIHPNLTMYKYHDGEGSPPYGWTAECALRELRARLPDTEIVLLSEAEAKAGNLSDIEALLAGELDRNTLERLPKLKWVQFPGSGRDHFYKASGVSAEEFEARGVKIINSPGISRHQVAEHVLAMMLALTRGLPRAFRQQDRREWTIYSATQLRGRSLGIIGLGAIGEEIAARSRSFGMHVTGTKRNPDVHEGNAHIVRPPSGNADVIAQSDYVVLAAPNGRDTSALFDLDAFRSMKRGAFFINISRGANVVPSALHAALQDGLIAGAGIDTFGGNGSAEPKRLEALPQESPLWDCPNLIVMPNNAASTDNYMANFADCVARQYTASRVRAGAGR